MAAALGSDINTNIILNAQFKDLDTSGLRGEFGRLQKEVEQHNDAVTKAMNKQIDALKEGFMSLGGVVSKTFGGIAKVVSDAAKIMASDMEAWRQTNYRAFGTTHELMELTNKLSAETGINSEAIRNNAQALMGLGQSGKMTTQELFDLTKTMSMMENSLGVQNQNMAVLAKRYDMLNIGMGQFNDDMNKMIFVSRQFGLTGSDVNQVLSKSSELLFNINLMYGSKVAGNYASLMLEVSTAARIAGMDLNVAHSIMGNLAQDALKYVVLLGDAAIYATPKEQLDLMVDSIGDIEASMEGWPAGLKVKLLGEIYGISSAEFELLKSIRDTRKEMNSIYDDLGKDGDAVEKAFAEATDTIISGWNRIKTHAEAVFKAFLLPVFEQVVSSIKDLSDKFDRTLVIEKLIELSEKFGDVLKDKVVPYLESLVDRFTKWLTTVDLEKWFDGSYISLSNFLDKGWEVVVWFGKLAAMFIEFAADNLKLVTIVGSIIGGLALIGPILTGIGPTLMTLVTSAAFLKFAAVLGVAGVGYKFGELVGDAQYAIYKGVANLFKSDEPKFQKSETLTGLGSQIQEINQQVEQANSIINYLENISKNTFKSADIAEREHLQTISEETFDPYATFVELGKNQTIYGKHAYESLHGEDTYSKFLGSMLKSGQIDEEQKEIIKDLLRTQSDIQETFRTEHIDPVQTEMNQITTTLGKIAQQMKDLEKTPDVAEYIDITRNLETDSDKLRKAEVQLLEMEQQFKRLPDVIKEYDLGMGGPIPEGSDEEVIRKMEEKVLQGFKNTLGRIYRELPDMRANVETMRADVTPRQIRHAELTESSEVKKYASLVDKHEGLVEDREKLNDTLEKLNAVLINMAGPDRDKLIKSIDNLGDLAKIVQGKPWAPTNIIKE